MSAASYRFRISNTDCTLGRGAVAITSAPTSGLRSQICFRSPLISSADSVSNNLGSASGRPFMFVRGRFSLRAAGFDVGRLLFGIDGEAEGDCDMRSGSSSRSRCRFRDDEEPESESADMLTPDGAVIVENGLVASCCRCALSSLGWTKLREGSCMYVQRELGERRPSKMLGGKSDCGCRTLFMVWWKRSGCCVVLCGTLRFQERVARWVICGCCCDRAERSGRQDQSKRKRMRGPQVTLLRPPRQALAASPLRGLHVTQSTWLCRPIHANLVSLIHFAIHRSISNPWIRRIDNNYILHPWKDPLCNLFDHLFLSIRTPQSLM